MYRFIWLTRWQSRNCQDRQVLRGLCLAHVRRRFRSLEFEALQTGVWRGARVWRGAGPFRAVEEARLEVSQVEVVMGNLSADAKVYRGICVGNGKRPYWDINNVWPS